MNKCVIYAAYDMAPKQYYAQDGTYKEYVKFFESELDCLRWCNKQKKRYSCETVWVEPDSEKVLKEQVERNKAR